MKLKHIFLLSFLFLLLSLHLESQNIPRPEHPQPQFERSRWINLNGIWDFTMQIKVENPEENWKTVPAIFDKKITVPFATESKLPGIEYTLSEKQQLKCLSLSKI